MGLSTAERNRRKRERKKREKEERRKEEAAIKESAPTSTEETEDEVEIEYVVDLILPPSAAVVAPSVPDGLPPGMNEGNHQKQPESMESVLRKFHQRAAVAAAVVSDDERKNQATSGKPTSSSSDEEGDYDDEDDEKKPMSKRKLRELTRPSVADLKRRVKRPDLVEAHDITAEDPTFLIHLKSIPGTVSVPRHWGRKRKYLQGKRGFEKPPFQVSKD
jgi:splicing factor 3B subunit 2